MGTPSADGSSPPPCAGLFGVQAAACGKKKKAKPKKRPCLHHIQIRSVHHMPQASAVSPSLLNLPAASVSQRRFSGSSVSYHAIRHAINGQIGPSFAQHQHACAAARRKTAYQAAANCKHTLSIGITSLPQGPLLPFRPPDQYGAGPPPPSPAGRSRWTPPPCRGRPSP